MQGRIGKAILMLCMILLALPPGFAAGERDAAVPSGILAMDGYQIVFADVMADEINWAHDNNTPQADMHFYLQLSRKQNIPVFTMTMMQDQADYVAILTGPADEYVPVGFMLAEAPTGLSEKQLQQFRLAQQEVYVLLATMELTAVPPPAPETTQEPSGVTVVETEGLYLAFSNRWAERIGWSWQDDELVFSALISGNGYPAFSLRMGEEEGDIVISLEDGNGGTVSLASYLRPVPPELSAADRRTFQILQDVLGEVLDSAELR